MKKILPIILCIMLCLNLGLMTGCSNDEKVSGDTEDQEVYTIRMEFNEADDGGPGQAHLNWEKAVEEAAGGRLNVEFVWKGTMTEREILEGTISGAIHGGCVTSSYFAAYLPDWSVLDLPYLCKSREDSWEMFDGAMGDYLKKIAIEGLGVEPVAIVDCGMRLVCNKVRPVKTPEDLKGLKLRVMESSMHIDTYKSMGASPVAMAYEELYTALQQGTIDGLDTPLVYEVESKAYEQIKYYTATDSQICPMVAILNYEYLSSLPEDLQEIIRTTFYEDCTVYSRENGVRIDNESWAIMEKAGVERVILTDEQKQLFIDATKPVWDKYRDTLSPEVLKLAGR